MGGCASDGAYVWVSGIAAFGLAPARSARHVIVLGGGGHDF